MQSYFYFLHYLKREWHGMPLVKFVCIHAWMLKFKKTYVSIMKQANKLLLIYDFKYKSPNELRSTPGCYITCFQKEQLLQ